MRTISFSFLLVPVFMGITIVNTFPAETVESMAMRVTERLETIDAVEFTLRVKANTFTSPEIKETREEYAFFRSKDPDYPHSWERWKVFYEKKPGVWRLDRFVVFDGKTLWTWDRVIPPHPDNPEGFNIRSRGVIMAVVTPETVMYEMHGNEFWHTNEFPDFLFMGVGGYGERPGDDFLRSLGLDKWQIVESAPPSEFVLQRVVLFPDWKESDKYFIRVHIRLEPIPVVWCSELATDFFDKTEKFDFWAAESFATFDGIYYPAKGRSVSYANANIPFDEIYEFEVESVRRLTEKDKAQWVPNWPTGTIVTNMVFGKENLEIRHTKDQMLEKQEEYYAKLGFDREIKTQSRRNWFIIIFNIIGILLILCWLLYKRFKQQKQ